MCHSFLLPIAQEKAAKKKAKAKAKNKTKPKPKGRPKGKAKAKLHSSKRKRDEEDEDDNDDDSGDGNDDSTKVDVDKTAEQAQVDWHASGDQVESEVEQQHEPVTPVELFPVIGDTASDHISGPVAEPDQVEEAIAVSAPPLLDDTPAPAPSSSSSVPPAPVPGDAAASEVGPSETADHVDPAKHKSGGGGGGGGGVKVWTSPAILARLEPNSHFKIGLNTNDHRFFVKCNLPPSDFLPPYDKKSFSKSFAKDRNIWQESLRLVHDHCWSKWELVKDRYPLAPSQVNQLPGPVPDDVFRDLKEPIESLGAPTQYAK